METEEKRGKPEFSRGLFWDTDPDKIDWDRQFKAVISRVMHRGSLEEWRSFRKFYGDERIKKIVPEIHFQDRKTEHYFKQLYGYDIIFRVQDKSNPRSIYFYG